MKIRPHFYDLEIFYQTPIKLPERELTSNIFSKISFPETDLKPLEIFTLPGFYQTTLDEKKTALNLFFETHVFHFDKVLYDAPFFNAVENEIILNGETIFDIECVLFPFINYPVPENLIIRTNAFWLNNFPEAKCVKIKISTDKVLQKELATALNDKSKEGVMPFLRFDGNRKFELDDLISFLNLLDESVIRAIEYIEEPFKNFYDIYSFQKNHFIKIGIDESLVYFLNHLEKLPTHSPIILKPALYGISKSFDLIKKASLLGHSAIISSTYQPASSFAPLMLLAHYSDTLSERPLFHGLDTLKFLPKAYQNDQIINSLSIS